MFNKCASGGSYPGEFNGLVTLRLRNSFQNPVTRVGQVDRGTWRSANKKRPVGDGALGRAGVASLLLRSYRQLAGTYLARATLATLQDQVMEPAFAVGVRFSTMPLADGLPPMLFA